MPNLIANQIASFDWLKTKGIKDAFKEISPIRNYAGNVEIYFNNYYFDEPKYDEKTSLQKNITYEAPLKCMVELRNKAALIKNSTVEQEIYLGDFPIMTKRGTFIINGVERVVVPQLIRSPGVFFTARGAKIIPTRGAWLEIEQDSKNIIWAKIDKKRKIEMDYILRVFGVGVDVPEDKAYIEIYRRLRPGDLATIDNAKSLVDNMFFNQERYDLGEVGRYMMNRRLDKIKDQQSKTQNLRILTREDLMAIVEEIKKRADKEPADDIDHLANRRVKMIGELVQDRFRIGMVRMQRNIRDKMSTLDVENIVLSQLINSRPLVAAVKEFFASSQLSQFMDQVNPLAELEHKRRLSAMGPGGLTRERAGFEARDVHSSHYGRICPIQSSEGPNIGLVVYLSNYVRINEHGFLETPYYRVKKGKAVNEIVFLNAYEEEKYVIAPSMGNADRLPARVKGQPKIVARSKIDFVDVSPKQLISVSTSLIPFLEHDDGQRALMGSNMQRQAVSCIKPESPVIGTGQEERAATDSGQVVVSEESGKVVEIDGEHIRIGERIYALQSFARSNADTSLNQRPIVQKGDLVLKGQAIADGAATDKGELALGQNLLVAFMNWEGWNYEDAIVISQKVAKEDRFTSIHIEEFVIDVRDTKLGSELTTRDIPNVGEEKLRNLDNDGIIRLGAEVGSRDILVGKISPKGEKDLTAEERLLRAIFGEKARDVKDTSLLLPYGKRGKVVDVKIFSRDQGDKLPSGVIQRIQVCIAQLRSMAVGDKLAGRHGNKGVIAAIVPEEDMPYLPDGRPVDIVLSPLGVVSRMNIGQILETHLGWAAQALGYKAACPAFNSASEEDIRAEFKKAGLPKDGQIRLCDGRTGKAFDHKTTVGIIYMMKLHHLVEDKIHMRSTGPYSLITQQPLGGKAQFGGQRFGEMEVWALEGYGAAFTLQEMLTIKSDDILGRSKTYESIIKGEPIKAPNVPASFNVLVQELKALGLSVELK
ncbi:MAG: DNA-directed RNA polymerase subunit beta [bacterium]